MSAQSGSLSHLSSEVVMRSATSNNTCKIRKIRESKMYGVRINQSKNIKRVRAILRGMPMPLAVLTIEIDRCGTFAWFRVFFK